MSSAHRLIVVGSSRISFAAIERLMVAMGERTQQRCPEQVLRWVAGVVGGMRVLSVKNPSRSTHRPLAPSASESKERRPAPLT
jgi:hypothetical protein